MPLQTGYKDIPIKELHVECSGFDGSLSGLRILQLSDLHLKKSVSVEYMKALVGEINKAAPDIVLISGDILQCKALHVKEHIEAFGSLKADTFYVSGNHDMVYGIKELAELMQMSGVASLDDTIRKLEIKGAQLQLIGLSDRYGFVRGIKRPISELFPRLDANIPTILLTHQPKDIVHVGAFRVDFHVSGHTHGGQIYPLNKLVKLFQPYLHGFYRYKNTLMYVSSGLGYWGIDIRYGVPSEIPLFTIN